MHPQSGERRFERFPSHIIEIDINAVRRLHVQLFEDRADLVIEGDIKPTFFSQETIKKYIEAQSTRK